MTEWYYARGGQQSGPVSFEQLGQLAKTGGLDAVKDLVWTATMKDWVPAGQVEGLFSSAVAPVAAPPTDPSNPYATPQSAWIEPIATDSATGLNEIIPGSEPIDPVACVKRGFDLTKRQFGSIVLVGLVYFVVIFGLSMVIGMIQSAFSTVSVNDGSPVGSFRLPSETPIMSGAGMTFYVVSQLASQVFSIFMGLGLTRVGLNLVSGKEVSVGMLFGEGHKLLRAVGATILFFLMLFFGFLLLIVPGIYLMLRYGQYMNAIVDRDLGVMDSFSYSSSLTTNNKLQLVLLWILCLLVTVAGMIACGVGMIFAGPVAWLSMMAAYRWMQYGHAAMQDQPGTTTPLLAAK